MPDIGRVLMLPCQSSVGKIIPASQKGGISPEGKKQGSLIPGGEKSWVLDQEGKVHRSFFLGTKLGLDSEVWGGLWNLDHV